MPLNRSGAGEAAARFLRQWVFTPMVGVRLGDWCGLLRRHGGSITPRYWPRVAFTTSMAALNSALAWREKRLYDQALSRIEVRAPVFIIGHYRSGTSHLWNLLATDSSFVFPTMVASLFPHTFLTFENSVRRFGGSLVPKRRGHDGMPMGLDVPLEEERALCTATFLSPYMARHFPRARSEFERYLTLREVSEADRQAWLAAFDHFARKLSLRMGTDRTLLFKGPAHTGRIALLRTLYPDARFVHVHRDPYAVFASTRHWERATLPFNAYQSASPDDDLDEFILRRYRTMYDAFHEDVGSIPDGHLCEIPFADLERDPVGSVARIYDDLGLGGFPEMLPQLERYVDRVSNYRRNDYPSLSPQLRRRVAARWHRSFLTWGYST